MNKREIGKIKEELSIDYLKKNGYEILNRNYFTRYGEIDIIAKDDETLCFIEVKYRSTNLYGLGVEAVNSKKQQKIKIVSKYYLTEFNISDNTNVRYDIISIDNDIITLYKGAFI